jgi:hypothetical protein
MNQKEAPARAEKPLSLNPAMAAMGKKRFDDLANIQSDLLEVIREANQNWLDRMQSEATLASASHSIADTTAACQEWVERRMELFTEDGQRLMTNGQKFMEKAAQFLSNSWLSNGRTGGSA